MAAPTLHYLFDPFCGWCYAAAPLVQAARGIDGLALVLHGGGMMSGRNVQPVTPALRAHVVPHDRRIAELSGQPFGDAYVEGLLRDTGAVFDSTPAIAAILAADGVAGRGTDMLARQQQAHYVGGRRIADAGVLAALAADLGLNAAAFATALRDAATTVDTHIAASRALLGQVGGQGFPTFALSLAGEAPRRIDATRFIGQPGAWQQHLRAVLP